MIIQMILSRREESYVWAIHTDLSKFKSKGSDHIITACHRPTVAEWTMVHSATVGRKLLVSNVNLQGLTRVCGFDARAFPDCLKIATDDCLHLGEVDDIEDMIIFLLTFPFIYLL